MNIDYQCFASDYHPDLIELWKQVQNDNFTPPIVLTLCNYSNAVSRFAAAQPPRKYEGLPEQAQEEAAKKGRLEFGLS